jgi:hypothetical protein
VISGAVLILVTLGAVSLINRPGTIEIPGAATPPTETKPNGPMGSLHKPVHVGQLEIIVGAPNVVAEYGDDLSLSRSQGIFWVFPVLVKNISGEPCYFDATAQVAYDRMNRRYEADEATTVANYAQSFPANINPGNSVRGNVVFDIGRDRILSSIELHDNSVSDGVSVRVG